jgi:hypothetical protein
MRSKRIAIVSIFSVLVAFMTSRAIAAGDTGNFIVQLGTDTTSVETYTRTENRVEVDQCGRAPRLQRRRFVYDYTNGALTHFSMVVTPPGETTPTQVESTLPRIRCARKRAPRSAGQEIQRRLADRDIPSHASPWSGYETQIMKLIQSKSDSLIGRLHYRSNGAVGVRFRKQADGTGPTYPTSAAMSSKRGSTRSVTFLRSTDRRNGAIHGESGPGARRECDGSVVLGTREVGRRARHAVAA